MAIIIPATAFAQNATSFTMDREERSEKGDVIMLSQRYNNEEYGNEIVGAEQWICPCGFCSDHCNIL
jgi:hypothetical protein